MVECNRSALLIGEDAINKLVNSHVMVIGLGGVGGFCVEALARSGVGELTLVDYDRVDLSNCNRQIIATTTSVGEYKTDLFLKRIQDINPNIKVNLCTEKYQDYQVEASLDYIVDCMDDVKSKVNLMAKANALNIPLLTVCGTARKSNPLKLKVTRLDKTENDPLAKSVRTLARKNNISIKNKAIYSTESAIDMVEGYPLPSMIFVPSVAGVLAAQTCVMDIITNK